MLVGVEGLNDSNLSKVTPEPLELGDSSIHLSCSHCQNAPVNQAAVPSLRLLTPTMKQVTFLARAIVIESHSPTRYYYEHIFKWRHPTDFLAL